MELISSIEQGNAIIIDVREPFEFEESHIEGAINIPLTTVPSKADELKKNGKDIVFYCRSGNRSGQAAAFMNSEGFPNAFNGGSLNGLRKLLKQA